MHVQDNVLIGSTVCEVIDRAPAILGAYVEPELYRNFPLLNIGGRKFLTRKGRIIGRIDTYSKILMLSCLLNDSKSSNLLDELDDIFPDYDIRIRNG